MIEYLSGKVLQRLPHGVILDVAGVGYGLSLTLPTVASLPREGEALALWVYTRVREDAISLYGFMQRNERRAFEVLLAVNGVGPKVALAILSSMSLQALHEAVLERQADALTVVPGIGKRTAEKIVVELQGALTKLPWSAQATGTEDGKRRGANGQLAFGGKQWPAQLEHDLSSALANLGFKDKDVSALINDLRANAEAGDDFQVVLRRALSVLGKRQELVKKVARQEPSDLDQLF